MTESKWKVIVVTKARFTLYVETTKGEHEWSFDNPEDLTEFYRSAAYTEEIISAAEDA